MMRTMCLQGVCLGLCVSLAGCLGELERQTAKDPNSIIGKTTQNIGEFDASAGKNVSDSKIRASDPITAPLVAYQPMIEKTAQLQIDHALGLYYATEGRYPKDHEEFMTSIIKANNIRLPMMTKGHHYEYDVANHKLVIVSDEPQPTP